MHKNHHALVTGGGTGVGAAIAHRLADAGYKVTIMGRREAPLQSQNLPYVMGDVTDALSVQAAFEQARDARGPIDIVIANAGAATSAPFAKTSLTDFQDMMNVNVTGVWNVWQAGLPDMQAAGFGRMIAIASLAGLKGYSYVAPYCAAKHAVVGLTRALALELATKNITVNALCPGFVETPLLERSLQNIMDKTGLSRADAEASLQKDNPQKRFIQPEEIASAALWICSDDASSFNGQAMTISGGEN